MKVVNKNEEGNSDNVHDSSMLTDQDESSGLTMGSDENAKDSGTVSTQTSPQKINLKAKKIVANKKKDKLPKENLSTGEDSDRMSIKANPPPSSKNNNATRDLSENDKIQQKHSKNVESDLSESDVETEESSSESEFSDGSDETDESDYKTKNKKRKTSKTLKDKDPVLNDWERFTEQNEEIILRSLMQRAKRKKM